VQNVRGEVVVHKQILPRQTSKKLGLGNPGDKNDELELWVVTAVGRLGTNLSILTVNGIQMRNVSEKLCEK